MPDRITRCRPLLGTFVEVTVPTGFETAADAAFAAIAHIYDRMSFHEASSDLAAIRQAMAGEIVPLAPETVIVLRQAQALYTASNGLFDIGVGRELVRGGFLPGEDPDLYPGTAADIVILDDRHIRMQRRVLVDLGGIAKGHAVDCAIAVLIAHGVPFALVNAGGDLRGHGPVDWEIGLADADGVVREVVAIRDGALATSANLLTHTPHIGRDRQVVRTDTRVTVAAETCVIADALTKIALVEPDLADTIARAHGGQVLPQRSLAGAETMPHRRTARLSNWQMWLLIGSGFGLWLSGACWLLLHYFGQVTGEFGPETNPAEPWMMKVHGATLIAMLLGIGGLFLVHIAKGWSHRHQRVAGIALSAVLAVLVISGYLLYYAGSETARPWISLVHWIIGLALPIVFGWHYLNARMARRRKG